jgi:O-antigen/teichoic acid export membrane protein
LKNQIITKNFLSKIIFTIINIGLGFLVTPILIKFLGKEEYSLYKLTFDWLSSIGFVEQVITSSALAIIANANIGNRDQYTSKAFKKFFTFSLFFIFLAIIITPLLPYFYQITENKKLDVQISFIIGSLSSKKKVIF